MTSPTSLRFTALSDVGRVRRDNQDSGYAGPYLLVIADGVGGAARGDIASSVAVEALRRLDMPPAEGPAEDESEEPLSRLAHAIHLAHDRLGELVEQHRDLDGTSTTVTAALFDGADLHVGHVGDSRGYLLRDGHLEGLTTDHTLVQSLVDEGRITEAEARVHPHRNLILKAVDGVHEPEPDLFTVELQPGDRLLLCSDGCSGVLDNEVMADILGQDDLDAAAAQLVRAALDAGSSDNVTVVLAHVVAEEPDGAGEAVVVGAAVAQPQLRLDEPAPNESTAGDIPAESSELDEDLDPEQLRYAPRAPRRYLWLRRLLVTAVVLGLLVVAGTVFRGWAQQQYYVGDDDGDVVVFRGLSVEVPWISPREVAATTGLRVEDLQDVEARAVRAGIPVAGVEAGRRKAGELRLACPDTTGTPNPTTPATPTTPTTPAPTTPGPTNPKSGPATANPATPTPPPSSGQSPARIAPATTATAAPCDEAP